MIPYNECYKHTNYGAHNPKMGLKDGMSIWIEQFSKNIIQFPLGKKGKE